MVKFCVKKVEERTGFVRGLSMEDRKNLAGRKPTGPRTTVGKLRSRTNALKHGLYARNVLSAEMRKARQRYQRRLTRLFRPTDPSSRYLIEELAADLETADRLRALEIQITADFEHQSRIQRLLDHFRPSTFPQVTAAGTGCLLDRVDDPDTAEEIVRQLDKLIASLASTREVGPASGHVSVTKIFGCPPSYPAAQRIYELVQSLRFAKLEKEKAQGPDQERTRGVEELLRLLGAERDRVAELYGLLVQRTQVGWRSGWKWKIGSSWCAGALTGCGVKL
jgi:hypothetical protein